MENVNPNDQLQPNNQQPNQQQLNLQQLDQPQPNLPQFNRQLSNLDLNYFNSMNNCYQLDYLSMTNRQPFRNSTNFVSSNYENNQQIVPFVHQQPTITPFVHQQQTMIEVHL